MMHRLSPTVSPWREDFRILGMPAHEVLGTHYPTAHVGPSPENYRAGPAKKRWSWSVRARQWKHDRGIMTEGHAPTRSAARKCAEAVYVALYGALP